MSKITNGRLNPVWHTMLYSCAHMATVGVKGLSKHNRYSIVAVTYLERVKRGRRSGDEVLQKLKLFNECLNFDVP